MKGLRTIKEMAAESEIRPTQVSAWKKELKQGGSALFERKNARDDGRDQLKPQAARLERILGRVVVEKEWLEKSAESWGSIHQKNHAGQGSSPAEHSQTMSIA